MIFCSFGRILFSMTRQLCHKPTVYIPQIGVIGQTIAHALGTPLPATLDMSIRHPPHVEQVLPWEHGQMAWVVHYWDEINNRNISSSEVSTQEDAMQNACNLMQHGHVVSHVAGPNGERIDIVDIRKWCSAHER